MKPFLRLFENSWTDWWQKQLILIFFLKKMLTKQFSYTTHKSSTNRILYANKYFPKKKICTQNLIFRVHDVVLDTIILAFFSFHLIFFFKNAKNSYFFCMACLCMPWSMSDNLKIHKFKIIIIEKFCQKLKVCYFFYIICERQLEDNSSRFLCIVNARPSNFWYFE